MHAKVEAVTAEESRRRARRRSTGGLAVLLLAAIIALLLSTPAMAGHGQVAIMQDDPQLSTDPSGTLQEMRHLGVNMVRVSVRWSTIAPRPNSRQRPSFNAADPNAYPRGSWGNLDAIVRAATARGIQVMFVPTGFAPLWAQGRNPGRYGGKYDSKFAWKPSASAYGQFVRAVGARYSGGFRPPGASFPLPRVSTWELYNEPNFGEDLAPQAIDGSRVLYAPRMFRALADAGWSALQATGHGRDTILIGALAARGAQARPGRGAPQGLPGTYGETKPQPFIRELYCLNGRYRRYLGAAAAIRGCPTTRAGYGRFRAQHPVLFRASGFSDHPYPMGQPPNRAASPDPSYTDLNELPRMARWLDRVMRTYGSGKRFPIWNTEYGYITCPPNCRHGYASAATAATYINWAEYLSWRNPRLASTMQYLLYDTNPSVGTPEYGGFSSGLIYYRTIAGGTPKPGYYAYRLPIFLPVVRARPGRTLEVWGAVRAAPSAVADGDGTQYVGIQFEPRGTNMWRTLEEVPVTDPRGYFDTRVAFPSSGSVRIAWAYPPFDVSLASTVIPNGYMEPLGATNSRVVSVTIG